MVGETQPLNSSWLMSNINTNTIPGIQLSEAKAALSTNEAGKKVLENYKNIPSGQDPKIDESTLTKLINDMSIMDPVHVMTPRGLVTVLDGNVIPNNAASGTEVQAQEPEPVAAVAPNSNEAPGKTPETEVKEPLAKITDPAKAFRKNTPDDIRKKAADGTLTVDEAKMWATTTSREGRTLLGISGRMDAADRDILIKQRFARKAGEKAAESPEAAADPEKPKTEGPAKSAARVITNAASAPVRWLMKGAGALAGIFSKGAKDKLNEWADGLKWQKPSAKAPVETAPEQPAPPPPTEKAEPLPVPDEQNPPVTTSPLPFTPSSAPSAKSVVNYGPDEMPEIAEADSIETKAKALIDAGYHLGKTPGENVVDNLYAAVTAEGSKMTPAKWNRNGVASKPWKDQSETIKSSAPAPEDGETSDPSAEETAKKELQDLGYLDDKGKITAEGKKIVGQGQKELMEFLEGKVSDADSAYTELRTASLTADLEELAATP